MRNGGGVGKLAINSALVIHSDVITQTNLEFRMIHSEGNSKNNNSQWIFPDEHLNAQAGNYLLTVSQTHELYLVSVFYITQ